MIRQLKAQLQDVTKGFELVQHIASDDPPNFTITATQNRANSGLTAFERIALFAYELFEESEADHLNDLIEGQSLPQYYRHVLSDYVRGSDVNEIEQNEFIDPEYI